MASILNADTTNGLKISSDTSGEVKIQSAGADIVTVNSTGITMAAGKTLPAASLTGTLPAIDGSALTNLPASTPDALTTASGSAPSYSARAWVNFNGTGTVAIRDSGNVSSITDNGTGNYDVNMTTAMPDVNYCVVVTGAENVPMSSARDTGTQGAAETTSIANVNAWRTAQYDLAYMSVAIFR